MSRRDEWREYVLTCGDQIMRGTTANHKLGDISRPSGDYFRVDHVDGDDYVGNWLTGFGFVGVRFPRSTVEPMTDEQRQWLAEHPVVIS